MITRRDFVTGAGAIAILAGGVRTAAAQDHA
jgi:hypothetical protein